MNILDFTLGAITLAIGLIAKPYIDALVTRIKRLFTAKKSQQTDTNVEYLLCKVEDLEEQINNIAEAKYVRERNRKNNIRREVRDYLKELRSDK